MIFEKLEPWQEVVINEVVRCYKDVTDKDEIVSLANYEKNDRMKVSVQFPKGSGHTFLTSYFANEQDSFDSVAIVYRDKEHLDEIIHNSQCFECKTHDVSYISFYELYYTVQQNYAMHPDENIKSDLKYLKGKLDKEIVVVDEASKLPKIVYDFLLGYVQGVLLLLD